jgi:hypothetical protein
MPSSTGRSFENRIERLFLSGQLGIIRGFEGTSKAGQVFTQKEFGIGQQPLLTRCRFHKSFAYMEGEGKFPASENRIRLRQPHFSQLNTNVRRRSACPMNVLKRSAQIRAVAGGQTVED